MFYYMIKKQRKGHTYIFKIDVDMHKHVHNKIGWEHFG